MMSYMVLDAVECLVQSCKTEMKGPRTMPLTRSNRDALQAWEDGFLGAMEDATDDDVAEALGVSAVTLRKARAGLPIMKASRLQIMTMIEVTSILAEG